MEGAKIVLMKTEKDLIDLVSNDLSGLQKMCRLCLCSDVENPIQLFDSDDIVKDQDAVFQMVPNVDTPMNLWEKIVICGRVRVHNYDKLPKIICRSCETDLDFVNSFRIKCQKADLLVRKALDQTTVKFEIEIEKPDKDDKSIVKIKEEIDNVDDDGFDSFVDDEPLIEAVIKAKKKKKQRQNDFNVTVKKDFVFDNGNVDLKLEQDLEQNDTLSLFDMKGDGKYVCEFCNKIMKNKYILAKHIKVIHGKTKNVKIKRPEIGQVTGHGADRRFHCPECDYNCRRRQTLQYHMSTHTGEKPFKCDECPRSFAQHASLYTHRKTHSDKMYYTCQECGRQFKHYSIFKSHRKVHSTELNFICTICNKAMKTQKTLNDHMNRHLQIKKFSCEYCGRSFVTQSCLILHLRVHNKNKERKFKCSFCEISFFSKGALDIHVKRHTGIRSFSCDECNHMCYTRGELKTHSRKHTKEQNYACPLCDMKFRHSPSLNKHMLRKHGEKFKWSSTIDRRIVK